MPKPTPRRAQSRLETKPISRRAALQGVTREGSVIYAVRLDDGTIKIGYTTDLPKRLQKLGGEFLAFKYGTLADELSIHHSLNGHATQGREYYLPTPSVLKVVNTMRANLGLDPIFRQAS